MNRDIQVLVSKWHTDYETAYAFIRDHIFTRYLDIGDIWSDYADSMMHIDAFTHWCYLRIFPP
jgi:hypothetical protein